MNINKRKFQVVTMILIVAIVMLLVSFFNAPTAAFANSAPPTSPDGNSGIVFKEHEYVQIQSEVLDIQINDNATANIKASYTMKNTSAETLNVETMFITPVRYSENRNINVQRNGTELAFTKEFYGLYSYDGNDAGQSIDDWESVLGGIKSQGKPLGEGTDFWEYRVTSTGSDEFYVRFLPEIYYFRESQGFQSLSANKVELRNYKSYGSIAEDIVIVSKQNFTPETNGDLIKTEIDDIYEYLYEKATRDADEYQLRFAEQQYNLYLSNFDGDTLDQSFFQLEYIDEYIGAITYFVDFAPNEEVKVAVSYICQLGTSSYSHTADLLYYLSPAKYWKNFADLEINLTLSEKYKELKSSSLVFTKIDDKNYQYISTALPDTELKLTVSDGAFFTQEVIVIIILIVAAVVLILIPAAIVIELAIKKRKKKATR